MVYTVELDANPKTGTFPLTVTFTGRITGYANPSALQWLLDFKDGQVEWGKPPAPDTFTVEHTYENPGTYEVSLGSNDGISEAYDFITITVVEAGIPLDWWIIAAVGGGAVVLIVGGIVAYQELLAR